ncbi:MAG: UDP-N-acetylmuramate dehydrogenase [Bacteroidales bacterium]|nr:UDP-N-acetylmuramate dehydrogenase [Bacteroidales bacterium]
MTERFDAYDLSRRNTFGMKVSCRAYVEISDPEDLLSLDFDALPQPIFVMGGGSNLLFTKDFPGTVLHLSNKGYTVIPGLTRNLVRVGAGVVFDDFCAWAAAEGLWGPENLSLIPGEVGASAVQNIGAYGVEAKDIIDTVHAFDRTTRTFVDIPGSACGYGYRTSLFKTDWKGRYIITAVTFRLSTTPEPKLDYGGVRKALEARFPVKPGMTENNKPGMTEKVKPGITDTPVMPDRTPSVMPDLIGHLNPQMIRDTIIEIRRTKLPDPEEIGSAGSFFCNPVIEREHFERIVAIAKKENGPEYEVPHYDVGERVKVPAAWMIDQCGFKGMKLGGAQVYPKQPLVIVNATGDATPDEIIALETKVIGTIREKYGIELHPEVEHV